MRFSLRVLVCALLALFTTGCPGSTLQVQAQAANAVATAANASLPILIAIYRQEGLDVIDAIKAAGGNADTARKSIDVVKAKWAKIWGSWAKLKDAESAWATAIEAGDESGIAVVALQQAYCALEAAWPASVPAMPVSFANCGGTTNAK